LILRAIEKFAGTHGWDHNRSSWGLSKAAKRDGIFTSNLPTPPPFAARVLASCARCTELAIAAASRGYDLRHSAQFSC
jgi:hypothetical protein